MRNYLLTQHRGFEKQSRTLYKPGVHHARRSRRYQSSPCRTMNWRATVLYTESSYLARVPVLDGTEWHRLLRFGECYREQAGRSRREAQEMQAEYECHRGVGKHGVYIRTIGSRVGRRNQVTPRVSRSRNLVNAVRWRISMVDSGLADTLRHGSEVCTRTSW